MRLCVFLFGPLALLLAGGCGDRRDAGPTGQLTGRVLLGDQALRSGTVIFVDAGGKETPTAINREGKYRVTGLAVGLAHITVVGHAPTPFGPGPQGPPDKLIIPPERYSRPAESDLTVEVRGGEQEHNIVMRPLR